MKKSKQNILILTLSGGGGHLQAARAKEQECRSKHHKIIKRDLFEDYLGHFIGSSCSWAWNSCQTHGKTTMIYLYSFLIKLADPVFGPFQAISLLKDLHNHNIDHVIDTQVLGTKMVIKAIRLTNYLKKKNITYEKVLTDLPTPGCSHFFYPIRHLSKKDKKLMVIKTCSPLLDKEQSERDFWQTHTGLEKDQVVYSPFPLRKSFYEKETSIKDAINLDTFNASYTHALCACMNFGNKAYRREKNFLSYTFGDEKTSLISLGAFPHQGAVLDYIDAFIDQKNAFGKNRNDVLFILSGRGKSCLQFCKRVTKKISKRKDYPKNLTIIPLAYQSEETIAPLFFNVDLIIAKSGGLTSMELLTIPIKHIYIHVGQKPGLAKYTQKLFSKDIDSMPPWERGNAQYLIETKKAQKITPELFSEKTKSFFS